MQKPCERCGKLHRGYSDLNYLECRLCCKEVGSSNLIYPGAYCKDCRAKIDTEAQTKRKAGAVPGLVEVVYGVLAVPPEGWRDGGSGYAYWTSIDNLEVGDVVLVPGNWLHREPQEATVVSTYSAYDGQVSSLLRLLVKRSTPPTPPSPPKRAPRRKKSSN